MGDMRAESPTRGDGVRTEIERSLHEWELQVRAQQEDGPPELLRSHVNVKQMGTLKRKHGKGASLVSHYREEVQCWIENNSMFISDGEGGSDKWDLNNCQLLPPRSEKLDRFKLCMVEGSQRHQSAAPGGLKEVSLMAQTPAEAQEWVRAILTSQKVAEATAELQVEHERILKGKAEVFARAMQQLTSTGSRLVQLLKDSARKTKQDFEKDLEAAISMRDQALEQNEILRNEQLMLQEEVGRVSGANMTLSTQHLPEDVAQMQHLTDVADQLKMENKKLQLENRQLRSEAESLADVARKYQSAESRLESLQRLHQQNQLPSSVLQQQATNSELNEEILRMDRKLRDQTRAFSSYSNLLESTIENCMSRLEAVDQLLQDLRQREGVSLTQKNALIEWAKSASGFNEHAEVGTSNLGVPMGLMEALQEQYNAQRDRLAFLEESDRKVRADCLQTIMLLKSMQAKSRQRGSPFDYIEDPSHEPILRASS